MHRAYQPLKPTTNRYLQQRWDQTRYEEHVSKSEEERLATIERDNHLLSSKLADIMRSKGLVDHSNNYPEQSLNTEKRRHELLQVTRQNQVILQRISARQSEYRRQVWEEDWEKVERRRDDIARYPRGVTNQQRTKRKVKFGDSKRESLSEGSETNSNRETGPSEQSSEVGNEEHVCK